MSPKANILFLCTGNSCRSQMAEAFLRELWPEKFSAYSAGIAPKGLDSRAVKVMNEVGIDIKAQPSQSVSTHVGINFDLVVTVCGHADENCPIFPGDTIVIHVGFDDPPQLARDAANEEEILAPYRRVRNEIKSFIKDFPNFYKKHRKDFK